MLTREDLENRKDWRAVESTGFKAAYLVLNSSDSKVDEELKAAAPKLALACLEARKFCLIVLETSDSVFIENAAHDLRSLLFNELTAAGIEVP